MTFIILVAGQGTRLHPLTLHCPKTLYKLEKNTTVLQRMVRSIRKYSPDAEIVVVGGFLADDISKEVENENVIFLCNPFFSVTNSIASLWFARKFMNRDNVVLVNGDIVLEGRLYEEIICKETLKPFVLVDSFCQDAGDYNVQVKDDRVLVMSKQLSSFYGEYACLIKLDGISARLMGRKIDAMVNDGMYDQYMENALVQMIFQDDFELFYKDIKDYHWTEIDCVDDLLKARDIHAKGSNEQL